MKLPAPFWACRTAAIIGLDALVGLGGNISRIVILLATISFACATIFGLRADPMVGGGIAAAVPAAGALIVDHPWTLRPTRGARRTAWDFSSALDDAVLHVPDRLGTLMTNAQGYLRIPIGVGLSVVCSANRSANLVLGLVLVVAGVAAMTRQRWRDQSASRANRRPESDNAA